MLDYLQTEYPESEYHKSEYFTFKGLKKLNDEYREDWPGFDVYDAAKWAMDSIAHCDPMADMTKVRRVIRKNLRKYIK